MNLKIILGLVVLLAGYFVYLTYQYGGWQPTLTLQALWLTCNIVGFGLARLLSVQVSKRYQPAFVLAACFIVALLLHGAMSATISPPLSAGYDMTPWQTRPISVLFGWINWYFALGCLAFAIGGAKSTADKP